MCLLSTPLVSTTTTNAISHKWINADDLQARCNNGATANENNPCVSLMVDAVAYYELDDLSPTYFRLRSETAADAAAADTEAGQTATTTSDSPFLRNADFATEATLRWCNDFVVELKLCPWAKLSLAEQNAIRVKIIDQSLGIDSFEQIVRDSGDELLRLTGHDEYIDVYPSNSGEIEGNDAQTIDPNIAITFIVALPPLDRIDHDQEGQNLPDFGFASFHDFVFDLEDRLFEEADAFAEVAEQQNNQDGTVNDSAQAAPIGDWITVAPFHPAWSFEGEANSPVAWEKRTPFPTVSIVRSDAIEAAGEEATARIAEHNEEMLNDLGSHALRDLFQRAVLQKNV